MSSGGPPRNRAHSRPGCKHGRCGYHGGRGAIPGMVSACGPRRQRHTRAAPAYSRQRAGRSGRDARRCRVEGRTAGAGAGVPAVASTVAARRGRQPAGRRVQTAHRGRGGSRLGPAPGAGRAHPAARARRAAASPVRQLPVLQPAGTQRIRLRRGSRRHARGMPVPAA